MNRPPRILKFQTDNSKSVHAAFFRDNSSRYMCLSYVPNIDADNVLYSIFKDHTRGDRKTGWTPDAPLSRVKKHYQVATPRGFRAMVRAYIRSLDSEWDDMWGQVPGA